MRLSEAVFWGSVQILKVPSFAHLAIIHSVVFIFRGLKELQGAWTEALPQH